MNSYKVSTLQVVFRTILSSEENLSLFRSLVTQVQGCIVISLP